MTLSARQRVDMVLSLVEHDLAGLTRTYSDGLVRSSAANGDVCALLQTLGEIFFTDEQRDQLERIVQLHRQCCALLEHQEKRC